MGAPNEFHPDAHPEAKEITGDRNYGEWGQCIATAKSADRRCRGYAQGSHGKCNTHGGAEDSGAPENNGNAETHGLTADAEKWFHRHRDDVEEQVRLLVQSWMQKAPFGWDDHGNVWLLVECAIDEVRMQQADDYVDEEGIVVSHFDGMADDGRDIYEFKENPALLPKSRMKKDTVRTLKDLGVLDDPDSQAAESKREVADALREALDS